MRLRFFAFLLVNALSLHAAPGTGVSGLPDRIGANPGFIAQGVVEEYGAADLYEYIDGGADVYIEAGAKKCIVRRYGLSGEKSAAFEVAMYDMGKDLQAFGIFRQLQAVAKPGMGAESAVSSRMIAFWKAAQYVEVLDKSVKPVDATVLMSLAGSIAHLIPGGAKMPGEVGLLPDTLKIKGTERFWKSGFLSRSFFKDVVAAVYRRNGSELCTLFVMPCSSDSAAEKALDIITDAYDDENARVKVLASEGKIAGCVGCRKSEQESILLGLLLEHLRKR